MQDLVVDKTPNTPYVNFCVSSGVLKLAGRSIPENTGDFYYKLYDWLKEYFKNPKEKTYIHFQFEYINSGSSKCVLEIFKILRERSPSPEAIEVLWYYEEEDESMLELGEHYMVITELPFQLIKF